MPKTDCPDCLYLTKLFLDIQEADVEGELVDPGTFKPDDIIECRVHIGKPNGKD
jgi:hypothetical protein